MSGDELDKLSKSVRIRESKIGNSNTNDEPVITAQFVLQVSENNYII